MVFAASPGENETPVPPVTSMHTAESGPRPQSPTEKVWPKDAKFVEVNTHMYVFIHIYIYIYTYIRICICVHLHNYQLYSIPISRPRLSHFVWLQVALLVKAISKAENGRVYHAISNLWQFQTRRLPKNPTTEGLRQGHGLAAGPAPGFIIYPSYIHHISIIYPSYIHLRNFQVL